MAPHTSRNILLSSPLILAPMFLLTACVASNGVNDNPQTPALDISADSTTTKTVYIDGSSTVFPITEAIAQAYKAEVDNSQVVVSFSGTGGGFDKFCAEETDINDASRPISVQEMEACDRAGIRYIELPIAYDALTVVVNSQNDWAYEITLEELETIWESDAQGVITNWQQIRSSWRDRPLTLYAPGTDSGTYDYFTEVVIGEDSRSDYTASEDDTVLVEGVSNDSDALGYFGYAYYEENQDRLRALAIDSGNGAVMPSPETVNQAEYQPLSRPLFIYVNLKAAQENSAVLNFVNFYLENANQLVEQVGYIPLPPEGYHIAQINFQEGEVGTAFEGEPQPNLTIAELLRKQKKF